jgi:hypothetical protein
MSYVLLEALTAWGIKWQAKLREADGMWQTEWFPWFPYSHVYI